MSYVPFYDLHYNILSSMVAMSTLTFQQLSLIEITCGGDACSPMADQSKADLLA